MKKDFRVQYPLWQMAFIVLFGFFVFSVTSATTELINSTDEFSYSFELATLESLLMFGSISLTLVLGAIFASKIAKHNKQHPTQKLTMWQIRPLEFLEQDEGMTHITRKAAQKVYTFFVWALPALASIYLLFELSRFWMIIGILILALMQYIIYYLEVRKHLQEVED
ncbi:hypothetical protein [Paenisporosarcina sp. TG-14]|uniref:hypothetical protein n=1 Tax=Paenisporosarcina sp. TG-14 TaxID=1231057 RepID=UPI0002FDD82C|nr:hypothetical protein [Paenisporosarcina sp. TG-14]